MKINTKILLLCMMGVGTQASALALDYSGNVRLGGQYHDSQRSGNDISLGGSIHAQTKPIEGVSFGATFHTSNAIFDKNDANGVTFFAKDGASYSLLLEAYIQMALDNTILTLGRQILDTPFVDSDDIGMIPNAFEAYTLINHDISDSTIIYSYLRNMAGVDADVAERFTAVNDGSGAHMLGALYEGLDDVAFSAWFYALPHVANFFYVEGEYSGNIDGFSYSILAQGALQAFREAERAKVLGFATTIGHEKSALALSLAYDKSFDGAAVNGFGGGPYFVNCEHMTLEDVGKDGSIFVGALEWDASAYKTGLHFSLAKAFLRDKDGNKGNEIDFVLGYVASETLSFDAIYSTLDNSKISGDKFDNIRMFANYSF